MNFKADPDKLNMEKYKQRGINWTSCLKSAIYLYMNNHKIDIQKDDNDDININKNENIKNIDIDIKEIVNITNIFYFELIKTISNNEKHTIITKKEDNENKKESIVSIDGKEIKDEKIIKIMEKING